MAEKQAVHFDEDLDTDISDEDKEMVTKVFNKFDADGTGAVSSAELGNIMRSIGEILPLYFSVFAMVMNQECFQLMTKLKTS